MKYKLPFINLVFVSECDATHCNNANALQTLLLAEDVNVGGDSIGYTLMISCNNAEIAPNECHNTGAKSGQASRNFKSSTRAVSL